MSNRITAAGLKLVFAIAVYVSSFVSSIFAVTSWRNLKKVRTSNLVRSMGVWLIVVPVAAKFLSNAPETTTMTFFGAPISVDLTLPFSWKTFFLSALCFSIANSLFSVFAPQIVQQHNNHSDFLSAGKGDEQLDEYMDTDTAEHQERLYQVRERAGINRQVEGGDKLRNDFWELYDFECFRYNYLRLLVSLFYLGGLILLVDVALKNIIWVVGQIQLVEYLDELFFGKVFFWVGEYALGVKS